MALPQYCQIIVSKAQKNNEPLLSQAIWRDTILKHFACTRDVVTLIEYNSARIFATF